MRYTAPDPSIELMWAPRKHSDSPYHQYAHCMVTDDQLAYLTKSNISFAYMATIATKPTMHILSVEPCDGTILMRLKLLMGVEISYPDNEK